MTPLATITESNTYFDTFLSSFDWSAFTDAEKTKGLNTATRQINLLAFSGQPTDEDQENAFPRNEETDIPVAIISACCELAAALLDDIDMDMENDQMFTKSLGYSNVRSTYNDVSAPEHIVAGIYSITAWKLLLPYLSDVRTLKLCRV